MKSSRENERKRVLWRILEGTHEDKKAFHLSPCCSAIPTNASSDQKGRPKSEERRSSGSVAILDFEVTKGEGKRNKQTALLTKGGQKKGSRSETIVGYLDRSWPDSEQGEQVVQRDGNGLKCLLFSIQIAVWLQLRSNNKAAWINSFVIQNEIERERKGASLSPPPCQMQFFANNSSRINFKRTVKLPEINLAQ